MFHKKNSSEVFKIVLLVRLSLDKMITCYAFYTLHKICENTGFHWPVFSRIRTKPTILSSYGRIWATENAQSRIFYAVFSKTMKFIHLCWSFFTYRSYGSIFSNLEFVILEVANGSIQWRLLACNFNKKWSSSLAIYKGFDCKFQNTYFAEKIFMIGCCCHFFCLHYSKYFWVYYWFFLHFHGKVVSI